MLTGKVSICHPQLFPPTNNDYYLFMWLTVGIIIDIYFWTLGTGNESIQERKFQAFLGFFFLKGYSGGHYGSQITFFPSLAILILKAVKEGSSVPSPAVGTPEGECWAGLPKRSSCSFRDMEFL